MCFNNTVQFYLFSTNEAPVNYSGIEFNMTLAFPWYIVDCVAYNSYNLTGNVTILDNGGYNRTHTLLYSSQYDTTDENGSYLKKMLHY